MPQIQKVVFFIILTNLISFATPIFAQLEMVADGFQFVEGPIWKDGQLLFSDIPQSKIYSWNETDGKNIFLSPSGKSNGLALDHNGNLLMAQHGKRRIARLEADGTEIALATHYDGKKLNSPNDIAVMSDGTLFFTDPPYGVSSGQEELGYYGIYRISKSNEVQLLDKSLNRPNGIAFSEDEKKLYVTDAEARNIYTWDIVADTTIENKRLFAHINDDGYTDGLKVNELGRLFVTGPIGIWVYEPDGTLIETIPVPGQTSNCNWGGEDGKTLYITSGDAVYRYRSEITDVQNSIEIDPIHKSFKLYDVFPNPFNPATTIAYTVLEISKIQISVYNMLGQKVDELVNEVNIAGTYNNIWNAKKFSSGNYIVVLKTNSTILSKKMTLLK